VCTITTELLRIFFGNQELKSADASEFAFNVNIVGAHKEGGVARAWKVVGEGVEADEAGQKFSKVSSTVIVHKHSQKSALQPLFTVYLGASCCEKLCSKAIMW